MLLYLCLRAVAEMFSAVAFILYLLIFVFAAVFVLDWLQKQTRYRKLLDKIPGPPTYPLIGNIDMVLFKDPEAIFKLARAVLRQYEGKVIRAWLGPIGTIHITSPEDTESVISGSKHSDKGPVYHFATNWLGTGLLISAGAKWHERRKLLTPAFHFSVLQQFLGVFAEQTANLVKRLEDHCDKPHVDLNKFISNFTLNTICETAMGTRLVSGDKSQEVYRESVDEMGKVAIHRVLRPWYYVDLIYMLSPSYWKEQKLVELLHNFSKNVIREREKTFDASSLDLEKRDDDVYSAKKRLAMLDLLLKAKIEGENIDDEGIREEVDTFMFEGHDTTAMCLCCTLMLIASHPEIQEKIVQELDDVFGGDPDRFPTYTDLKNLSYLELCVKESLRLYPSVPLIGRVSSEDFTLASGYRIPKNTIIAIHIYDIHHDPNIYPNPYDFVPERFTAENSKNRHPYAYLPFSAGPRNCIGQRFAMMELKTVLAGILRKFKLEPVDRPSDVSLKYDIIMRTTKPVRVKFRPRKIA